VTVVAGRFRASVLAVTLSALGTLAAPAAPSAADAPRHGWVGRVPGTAAFVGVVARGATVVAYVCDGRRVGRWHSGRRHAGRMVVRDARGRRLTLRLTAGRATGSLTVDGRRRRFVARPARGRAGVFRRERRHDLGGVGTTVLSGWVRLNDGRVRGVASRRPLRVRRPRPDIEVYSLPQPTDEEIVRAAGDPPLGSRLALADGPCLDGPGLRFRGGVYGAIRSGPTCGLPVARPRERRRVSARVRERQAGLPLSDADLAALLRDLPRRAELERAELLQAAGLTGWPVSPSPSLRDRMGDRADAMAADKRLTDAAAALRDRRPDKPLDLFTAYEQHAARYLFEGLDLVNRPEVEVRQTPVTGTTHFTHEQRLTGPWALFEFSETNGWDAVAAEDITGEDAPNCLGTSFCVHSYAQAGFGSQAEFEQYAVLDIDIPAGASAVEIELDMTGLENKVAAQNCPGLLASAELQVARMVHAIGPDGAYHIFDDNALVGGYAISEVHRHSPLLVCSVAPPIPPPPPTTIIRDVTLPIPDPPAQGARFLLTVGTVARAEADVGGEAWASQTLYIDAVTVRSRF
jgi:hypothetical protein